MASRDGADGVMPYAWSLCSGCSIQAFMGCLSIISSGYMFVDLHWLSSHRVPLLSRLEFGTISALAWAGDVLASAGVVAAYLTLLRGHRVAAKILTLCILVLIAHQATSTAVHVGADWNMLGAVLGVVTVAALCIGFHRDAPPVIHRRRWFVAWVVGGGALVGAQSVFASIGWDTMTRLALLNVTACLLLAAGTIGYTVLHLLRPGRYSPAWPLALAILTVTVLVSLLGSVRILEPGQLVPVAGIGVAAGIVDVFLAWHAGTIRVSAAVTSPGS